MTIFGYKIIKACDYYRLLHQRDFYGNELFRRVGDDLQIRRDKRKQAKRQKRDKLGRFMK
jgi:hypothetical protein